jgi:hypothetical protein
MRSLLLLSAITLFFSSCSNQEEIEKYQRQLRESNEALEEVIDFRKIYLDMAAAKNLQKSGKWKELGDEYVKTCDEIIQNWPFDKGVLQSHSAKLTSLMEEGEIESRNCKLCLDSFPVIENSLLIKSHLLNNLNCVLQQLARNGSFRGHIITPDLAPYSIEVGDTNLNVLFFNLQDVLPEFIVAFEKPEAVDFGLHSSLGSFFIKKPHQDSIIRGSVQFIDYSSLQTKKLHFQFDSKTPKVENAFHTPPDSKLLN